MPMKYVRFLCLMLVVSLFCSMILGGAVGASAAVAGFAGTNVLDDLASSVINGQKFDFGKYPADRFGDLQLISFVEYGFSYFPAHRDEYGLYLYFYNPKDLNISTTSFQNKIQMAVDYDSNGTPTRFEKFNLEFCSVSDGQYQKRFYKYRIVDRSIDGKTFADRVNTNMRRYDISGVELLIVGDTNATEYHIGGTWKYTGFGAGLGADPNGKSTLYAEAAESVTLSLSVKHTNYRTGEYSPGHSYNVDTVYFSVPEQYFEDYGRLQRIHAEWWEYKTKMAAITSNLDFYSELLGYVGTDVGQFDPDVPVYLYAEYEGTTTATTTHHHYGWAFNKDMSRKTTLLGTTYCTYDKISTIMPYAFYAPVGDAGSVFDFLYSEPPAGSVESNAVQDWIYNYSNSLRNGYIACNGRKISKDLFEDHVDDGRTKGYNNIYVDLGDTFDLQGYEDNISGWWQKLFDYGFSWPKTHNTLKDIKPIYTLRGSDLVGTNAAISERLLVNIEDVPKLKAAYTVAAAQNERIILFRFAHTDYYAVPAFRSGYSGSINDTDTFVAQMSIFLDFDIIDLTFNRNGNYTVIPAVSDPIDIINGIDPPKEELNWLKLILAILMIVLLVVILVPVIPMVINVVLEIVMIPLDFIRRQLSKSKSGKKR